MKPTCPKCGIGLGELVRIVQGAKTYRFPCCSTPIAAEVPDRACAQPSVTIELPPQSKPLKQSKRRHSRPIIESPRRKVALPYRPDNLEHALDMIGIVGGAVNASQIIPIEQLRGISWKIN